VGVGLRISRSTKMAVGFYHFTIWNHLLTLVWPSWGTAWGNGCWPASSRHLFSERVSQAVPTSCPSTCLIFLPFTPFGEARVEWLPFICNRVVTIKKVVSCVYFFIWKIAFYKWKTIFSIQLAYIVHVMILNCSSLNCLKVGMGGKAFLYRAENEVI